MLGVPANCPVWVNETGWSETRLALDRDISKWFVGTGHGILVGMEIKFSPRRNSKVAGYVLFHTNRGVIINRKARMPLAILILLYL